MNNFVLVAKIGFSGGSMKVYFGFALADSMFTGDVVIYRRELTPELAKTLIAVGVEPCLNPSHQSSIDAMRQKFGIDVTIPDSPPRVVLRSGDAVIVMGVRGLPRMTDRHEYTAEEVAGATFTFSLYKVM